jgi:ADP-heptose:LPS heptosyltransferase/lauroyl/myristoyl acyltransferase
VIRFLTSILNIIPEGIQYKICKILGNLLFYLFPPRRSVILNNLFNVFPQKTAAWRKHLAKVNCQRWVETAWAFLVSSYWSQQKIGQHVTVSPALESWIKHFLQKPRPCVVLVPHLNLMETTAWLPAVFSQKIEIGAIYRPFRNKHFENWIKQTRERFNLQLISRKRGVLPLERILKHNGIVGILFDQSAGDTGILTTFFGKLASSTDLPGRLVEKFNTDVVAIYLRRTGFIRGEFCIETIISEKKALDVTFAANRWLEKKLVDDAFFYENWLWMHRRWKTQCEPSKRFCITQKRNCLQATMDFYKRDRMPRETRVWIRMPNWLGDCIMTYPILCALRKARPDFSIHLVAQKFMAPWLQRHFPIDHIHILPQRKYVAYFKAFRQLRTQYPETWINFPNSMRSDLESFCAGASQRFGLRRKMCRPLLTHTWKPTLPVQCHQTELWYQFFQNFGLQESIFRAPMAVTMVENTSCEGPFTMGCFCGSSNTPSKRWDVTYWQRLIGDLLKTYTSLRCILLGSQGDYKICMQVAAGLPRDLVRNLAGKTDLLSLEQILLRMRFVIANDSGGMHLANALGVPTVGLFARTQPQWSGPYFDAPKCIVQGTSASMESLDPYVVYHRIVSWLPTLEPSLEGK